jgi:hypothetical protein
LSSCFLALERLDLILGQNDLTLDDLLLDRRKAMLENLEIVSHPHAPHTRRRDMHPSPTKRVRNANLPKGRFVDGKGDDRFFDLGCRAVRKVRAVTRFVDQSLDCQ